MGVANSRSLAWSIGEYLSSSGAEVAFSYQNDKVRHRIEPLIALTNPAFVACCDVSRDDDIEKLFSTLENHWDHFDILIHAIAFANGDALAKPLVEINRRDFTSSLDISVYSLIAIAKHSERFMKNDGGSIVTLSYHGAQKVIPGYNIMGVVKAALESTVKYLANDLGPHHIRVNAISAGPVKTLASSAISMINEKLDLAEKHAPLRENITANDVAEFTGFLCGENSRRITGGIHYVDSGLNILGA